MISAFILKLLIGGLGDRLGNLIFKLLPLIIIGLLATGLWWKWNSMTSTIEAQAKTIVQQKVELKTAKENAIKLQTGLKTCTDSVKAASEKSKEQLAKAAIEAKKAAEEAKRYSDLARFYEGLLNAPAALKKTCVDFWREWDVQRQK